MDSAVMAGPAHTGLKQALESTALSRTWEELGNPRWVPLQASVHRTRAFAPCDPMFVPISTKLSSAASEEGTELPAESIRGASSEGDSGSEASGEITGRSEDDAMKTVLSLASLVIA